MNISQKIELTDLPNGLRIASVRLPMLSTVVTVYVNVGSRDEDNHQHGISHFIEHMMFKGTANRTCKDIATEIELIGAEINANTYYDVTSYFVDGLASHVEPALDILSDMIKNSSFTAKDIASEKEIVIQEIRDSNDQLEDVMMGSFSKMAFGEHPMSHPILGHESSVSSFDEDAIRKYLDQHYHAGNMIVVAVGDIDHDEFVEQVTNRFSDIPSGVQQVRSPIEYVGDSSALRMKGYEQTNVLIGFPCSGKHDLQKFAAASMLSVLLGGGMSSPLSQTIREDLGLCYAVDSELFTNYDTSIFMITGSTTPKQSEALIRAACAELMKIADGNISDNDFTRSQNLVLRSGAMQLEKPGLISRRIANNLFEWGELLPVEDAVNRYMAVTKEDIIDSAKYIISQKPTLVVAGKVPVLDFGAIIAESLAPTVGDELLEKAN
jgi:predicted Zn-dependent peptidase